MNTIVVFDSLHGNTERVARAIGEELQPLGQVRVLRTTEVPAEATADAWVIGGPTHVHGMSKPLKAFLDGIPAGSLTDRPVATFDTRAHYRRLLTGSAAHSAAGRLKRTGGVLIAEPESFFIEEGPKPAEGGKPDPASEHLMAGELERARAWGKVLAAALAIH